MRTFLSILLIVLIASAVWAEDKLSVTGDMTLLQTARAMKMPVKKLVQKLELPHETPRTSTIGELGITKEQLEEVHKDFHGNLMAFCTSITITGMLVVFLSLIVTGVIISQIKHINQKPKKVNTPEQTVKTSIGKVTGPQPDISTNAIIAVITALHLHIAEAEERQKLLLTWKRAPLSLWRGSSRSAMPNQTYFQAKGRS